MREASFTGPVEGGAHGWAFSAALDDLGAVGYVEDEWFVEGEATTYDFAPGAHATADGQWDTVAVGAVPYRTRVIARRPVSPARANGTVIVQWNNVTAGMDLVPDESREVLEQGYAVLAVTAQATGVHGYADAPMGLAAWDAERYDTLSIPTDDASYGIFADVARLARSGAFADAGPLAGITVERVVASGGSQSAARLHTYFNAVAPHEPPLDGLLLTVHFGSGTPLNMGGAGPVPSLPALNELPYTFRSFQTRLRTDLGTRIMVLNTETEARAYGERQPDDERFRLWEIAGAAHAGGSGERLGPLFARELGAMLPSLADLQQGDGPGPNDLDSSPVAAAAHRHLQAWLVDGTPPPSLPRIELDADGRIERDGDGIACGGIRLPDVMVPIATLTAETSGSELESLAGARHPFDDATLRERYGTRDEYLRRFDAAVDDAVRAGYVLEPEAEGLRARARRRELPLD